MDEKMDEEFDGVDSAAIREWVVVDELAGSMQAELVRGLLDAQGLTVIVSMEGVGRVHGLYVGPLANNQVLVPDDQAEAAIKVLQDYYAGVYEGMELENIADEAEHESGEDDIAGQGSEVSRD